jgi:hypothetical protein
VLQPHQQTIDKRSQDKSSKINATPSMKPENVSRFSLYPPFEHSSGCESINNQEKASDSYQGMAYPAFIHEGNATNN